MSQYNDGYMYSSSIHQAEMKKSVAYKKNVSCRS